MIISRNLARRTWALFTLALTLGLGGCSEKLPYSVAGTSLPDFSETSPQIAPPENVASGVAEALTFKPATPELYEQYVRWLEKQGWKKLTETHEVTVLKALMSKEGRQLTLTFIPSMGLTISGVRPATAADQATTGTTTAQQP